METAALVEQHKSLQTAFLAMLKAPSPREKADYMAHFLENFRCLVSSLSTCTSLDDVVRSGILASLLNMSQVAVSGLTTMSRSDVEELHYRQQAHVIAQLLGLLLPLPVDEGAKTKTIIVGIAHLWRLLFCPSDSSMDTTAEVLRLRSVQLKEVLLLVTSAYRRLDCGQNAIQLCYIMLEVFRHSDVAQHISNIITTLKRVPNGVNLAHIYPGLVSRIVVNLSKLRESDFEGVMHVLESWISNTLTCECTGDRCRKKADPTLEAMAVKTSDAIRHIFKKYSATYSQYMVGLCAACLRCGCLSPEAFRCLQLFLVQLLGDEGSWPAVRRVIGPASLHVKTGFWREVTSCLRSNTPEALKVYLGYVDLLSHMSDLEELDDYVTMELVYGAVEPLYVDSAAAATNFAGLALCDKAMDLGMFEPDNDALFTRVASQHIARMPPPRQRQCMSNALNYLLSVDDDTAVVARLLTLLHGFLIPGSEALHEIIPEVVDVVLVKVVGQGIATPMVQVCTLSVLSVVFDLYSVEVPHEQISDILFWSLPLCVSGSEQILNHSRALLSALSRHHMRTIGGTEEVGVEPLLHYYKNLVVSRCVRELRNRTSTAEDVANVLHVFLCYNKLDVKDLFDITLELDRFCQPSESAGTMPNLSRTVEAKGDVKLYGLYCYAFIAHYIDRRFDVLLQESLPIQVPTLQYNPDRSAEALLDSKESHTSVEHNYTIKQPTGLATYESLSDTPIKTALSLKGSAEVSSAAPVGEVYTGTLDFKDKRLAVATLIATRCRYYICEPSAEARQVSMFALHKCIRAFSHNVPVMRIRLYESWDPLFVCMEHNMRNLRIMTSIFGILRIAVRHAYDFVERWLVDIMNRLCDMLVEECSANSVTRADEANRSIRFKFASTMLEFVQDVSSRVVNRVLFSKLLLVALLMCRSTAPTVEKFAGGILFNLFRKNPPLIRNILIHIGSENADSVALLRFALKRDVRRLLPQATRMHSLLALLPLSNTYTMK